MEKRLQIYVNKDGSVEFKTALPTIYQYEDYVVYFDFEFESQPADEASVQIMFRRSDGKTSAYLPLVTTNYQKKLYSIKLDNPWFWYKPGLLTFKVNTLTPSGEKNYSTFSSDYASIDIIAVPDTTFMAPPMAPSAYEQVLIKIEEALTLDEFNEEIYKEKLVTGLMAGEVSDNGHKTTLFYSNTGGETKQVDINLPTNNVTKDELTTTLDEVNPVVQVYSEEPMKLTVEHLKSVSSVDINLPQDVVLESDISDVVTFEGVSTYDGVMPSIEFAKKAEEDSEGNRIIDTYANKNEANTFLQPQTFTERVDIKNLDGTIDSIKHINNNFLISSSTGQSLMNIDHNLNKVSFLNKDVVFDSDLTLVSDDIHDELNAILNKPVFVEIKLGVDSVYFEGLYRIPCNSLSTITFVSDPNLECYVCVVETTDSEATVLRYKAINVDGSELTNFKATVTRVIRVGDL